MFKIIGLIQAKVKHSRLDYYFVRIRHEKRAKTRWAVIIVCDIPVFD